MEAKAIRRKRVGVLLSSLGLVTSVLLGVASIREANASTVIPVQIDGKWFKLQSAWKEQCSASLFVRTGGSTFTKVPRGVTMHLRPFDDGGNDGDFDWRCGNVDEHSDAPGNGFNLLRVRHSDTSREISMTAFDICGNGTSPDQCF